ncbi:hypothetical protein Syun_020787 [Stephania yunnanensis]|uniref:Uncharacterized protein n=1 Tax=Stephania yunnanensis TaxID=152371 RepID=A0AAP0IEV0_9MAGN
MQNHFYTYLIQTKLAESDHINRSGEKPPELKGELMHLSPRDTIRYLNRLKESEDAVTLPARVKAPSIKRGDFRANQWRGGKGAAIGIRNVPVPRSISWFRVPLLGGRNSFIGRGGPILAMEQGEESGRWAVLTNELELIVFHAKREGTLDWSFPLLT